MTLEDLYRLLRSGHVQAQGIVDTIENPLLVLDQGQCVINANPAFLETFNVDRDDTIGKGLFELGDGQWDIADLRQLLTDVIPKSAAIVGYEVKHNFPGLGERTMLVSARRLLHPDRKSTEILLLFEDVTERQRLEGEKDILIAETLHRMKNLLAVVRALATQTQAKGVTGEQYRDAFMGRFEALLSAQDFSLSNSAETDLAALVRAAVRLVAGDRAKIDGPSVTIPTVQVMAVSMMLHELTTNALKYGALSLPEGTVQVSWSVSSREGQNAVLLDWQEAGGPAVSSPGRRGFGTRLIEFSASRETGGSAVLDFAPTGLRARITLPVA